MAGESRAEADDRLLVVRVATADGVETDHTYRPRHTSEAQELADIIQERIENAFVGTTPYLLLQDPAIMYNPDFIVRVAFELKRGEKVIEAVEQGEQRGPLGFRPR